MTAAQRIATAPPATASIPATWDIDPAHTSAEFEVRHLGISFVSGRFRDVKGTVLVDPARPEQAQVHAEIAAATVDTGVPPRDEHLRGPDFFDAARHPAIRFVGKQVQVTGPEEGVLTGELTIRGVTRPVALRVERTGEVRDPWGKQRVGVRAEGSLSLKDFGLTWNQPLQGGGLLLGDKVRIVLNVEGVQRS